MAQLWKVLHLRALNHKGDDDSYFINRFGMFVPKYDKGCRCREFWLAWIRRNPPVFDEGYFAWTVEVHNAVNKKLGKPVISVEEARKIYK